MSCKELVEQCKKVGVNVKYTIKQDLVTRLQEHYETTFSGTPDKEFFLYMRDGWKTAKKSGEESVEYFREVIRTWEDEENLPVGLCSQMKVVAPNLQDRQPRKRNIVLL